MVENHGQARLWRRRGPISKALIVGVVAAGVLLAGSVLLIHRDGTPHFAISAKPPPLSTGSMDDWTKTLCQPGSFQDGVIGSALPNATGTGQCSAQANNDSIVMGTYPDRRLLNNDMAQFKGPVYATIRLTSGEIFAFVAPSPRDRSVLDPLSKYGFTVHTG